MDAFFASAAEYFQGSGSGFVSVFCTVWRYLAPVLAVLLLWRCARPLLKFRREPETWAWLVMPDGNQLPLTHWENILGRAKGCDIVVDFPTVSRTHAVLTRYDDGSWSLTDIGSRGAVTLNGEPVQMAAVNYGDTISLGGVDMVLAPVTQSELEEQLASRTRPAHQSSPALTLFLLTVFQLLTTLQLWMGAEAETAQTIVLSFLGLLVMGWLLFAVLRMMRRSGYEVETLAFFLSTLGFAVIASDNPANLTKQLICLLGGIVIYLIIGWSLRDLSRAKKFRYLAAVGGMLLLLVNLVFGQENNGARNWISLGGHLVPAVRAGQALLPLCRRIHDGPHRNEAEPVPVHCLFRRHLRLPCPDERLRHGAHLLRRVPRHRLPAFRQLRHGHAGLRGHGLCRRSGRSLPAAYPAPLCNMGPCVGICLCGRLPADARDDVHRLRRSVRPWRRQRLAQICVCGGYGPRFCFPL